MGDCEEIEPFLPLQQSPVYAAGLRGLGVRHRWVDLGCGRTLVVERGPLQMAMRGPVWEPGASASDRRKALRRLARWGGLTVVTPEEGIGGFGLIPLVTPQHHAVWSLGPGIRSGIAANWLGSLRKAERAGLAVTEGMGPQLDRLIAAEALQRKSRGYRALPGMFTRALPADALRLWYWHLGGEVQAAMAFIRHGRSATYHLGWGTDAARAAGVHALLLTRAAEAFAAEGVQWLDLGLVDTERLPGLARFKLGTGAALHRLGATMLVLP